MNKSEKYEVKDKKRVSYIDRKSQRKGKTKKRQRKIENQYKTETKYGKNNKKNYIEIKNKDIKNMCEKDIKTARTIERMTERTKEKKNRDLFIYKYL